MKKQSKPYRSDAVASIHETMEGLQDIGAISRTTMRDFDRLCLKTVTQCDSESIRALRDRPPLQP